MLNRKADGYHTKNLKCGISLTAMVTYAQRIFILGVISCLFAVLGEVVEASFSRLPPGQRALVKKRLGSMKTTDLGALLEKGVSYEMTELVLEELSNRERKDAEHLIKGFLDKLPAGPSMVRPLAQVAMVRIQAGADREKYVKGLVKLLESKNGGTVDRAAFELGRVGTAIARRALVEHEATGRPAIKRARLMLDCRNLKAEQFVRTICSSARKAIEKAGKKGWIAADPERSLLFERALDEKLSPHIKEILQAETTNGKAITPARESYMDFLRSALEYTEKAEAQFVDKGTSQKEWEEQQVQKALKEDALSKEEPKVPEEGETPHNNGDPLKQ